MRTMVFANKAMATRSNLERETGNWLNELGTLPPGNGVEKDLWEGTTTVGEAQAPRLLQLRSAAGVAGEGPAGPPGAAREPAPAGPAQPQGPAAQPPWLPAAASTPRLANGSGTRTQRRARCLTRDALPCLPDALPRPAATPPLQWWTPA